MPFVFWINRAVQIIKQYCKSLGLKQSQLQLYDPLEEHPSFTSPYSTLNDNEALYKLTQQMLPGAQMNFFSQMDEGKNLNAILEKTEELKREMEFNKANKRDIMFDSQKYFKFLEHVQNCGLPINSALVDEAKVELKKERWIKKFNDLQQAGK